MRYKETISIPIYEDKTGIPIASHYLNEANWYFRAATIDEIKENLRQSGTDFGWWCLDIINQWSPTAL